MNQLRCRLMLWMLAGSLLGPIAIPPWLRRALAMGQKDFPQGMQTVEGEVRINGSLLSVFGKGKRRIVTATAVIGIRGTGVYVESEPTRAYVCTCYGKAVIESGFDRRVKETVKTRHHEKPRWVYGEGAQELLVEAPVINHTDEELILLESLVGRRPPFLSKPGYQRGSSGY